VGPEAERFARFVAAELARHYDDRTFRRLVLVAPAEFMGLLRRQLSPRVAGSIIEELTRDLSKERADALEDQVPIPHH